MDSGMMILFFMALLAVVIVLFCSQSSQNRANEEEWTRRSETQMLLDSAKVYERQLGVYFDAMIRSERVPEEQVEAALNAAAGYLKKAAQKGSTDAEGRLAMIYSLVPMTNKEKTKAYSQEAIYWYEQAVQHGRTDLLPQLVGMLYAAGDWETARQYATEAEKCGVKISTNVSNALFGREPTFAPLIPDGDEMELNEGRG